MQLSDLKVGDKSYYDARLDATYPGIVCGFHNGSVIVGLDDADNEVFSEDVGFQPDCPNCIRTAGATIEHVVAVEAHDAMSEAMYGKAVR